MDHSGGKSMRYKTAFLLLMSLRLSTSAASERPQVFVLTDIESSLTMRC